MILSKLFRRVYPETAVKAVYTLDRAVRWSNRPVRSYAILIQAHRPSKHKPGGLVKISRRQKVGAIRVRIIQGPDRPYRV